LTNIDKLTGLDRKDYFAAGPGTMLDAHPEQDFVLVYWNVNRFKVINDVFSSGYRETGCWSISAPS
jgi:GGDEF domain-containing protein